jgi:hypothetical protein
VRSIQHEAGLVVMIEEPQAPGIRVVTLLAFGTKCAFVLVISLMTAGASDGSVLELTGYVALGTGRGGMHANQREAGQVMIKQNVFAPALLAVAPFTRAALLSFVDVICLMAVDA